MSSAIKHSSIYHFISAVAEQKPEKIALRLVRQVEPSLSSQTLDYQQLFGNICQTARLIKATADTDRPVCSFLLPNIPQTHGIMWGAESVGIANPLNPLLNEDALLHLMELAQTDVIFALGPLPGTDIWQKAQAVAQRLDKSVRLISVMMEVDGYDQYEKIIKDFDRSELPTTWLPGLDDIASYFHTGGTTGTPKLAKNTHRNQLACVAEHHGSLNLGDGDVVINGLPLFHVAGSMINGLACLCAGVEIVLPTVAGFRDPAVVANHWRMVEEYKVTVSGGIPTSVASMLGVDVDDADISSLKYLISGGSPVSASLCQDVKRVIGLELYQIFGMTECAGGTAMPNVDRPTVPGSAGFVRNSVPITIQGAKNPGDSGELLIQGDVVFPGYLGKNETPLIDGFLHSGDLGHIDAQGYLFITGRAKDLIIRSGHNIDPALIENTLEQHDAVSMAAAVGKPDAYAGELPVVYVQCYDGAQVTEVALMEYAANNIAERPAAPKFVKILPELPTTAVGKIHKPTLRADAAVVALQEAYGNNLNVQARQLDSGQIEAFGVENVADIDVKKLEQAAASLSMLLRLDN